MGLRSGLGHACWALHGKRERRHKLAPSPRATISSSGSSRLGLGAGAQTWHPPRTDRRMSACSAALKRPPDPPSSLLASSCSRLGKGGREQRPTHLPTFKQQQRHYLRSGRAHQPLLATLAAYGGAAGGSLGGSSSSTNGGGTPSSAGIGPSAISNGGGGGSGALPPNTVKVYEAARPNSSKRIVAETVVQAPVDVVWRVLTNYERLADFVPNLEGCERLPCPQSGKIWLRQRGCSQAVLWRLEAEALLEVEEVRLPLGRREARFTMLEGDFKELIGRWVVETDPNSAVGMATLLRFDISVQPKVALPSAIVSYVVRAGLPANIQAVARRAEEIAARKLRASGLARWAGTEDDPPIPVQQPAQGQAQRPSWEQEIAEEEAARAAAAAVDGASAQQRQQRREEQGVLPSKGPFWRLTGSTFPEAAPLTAARQRQRLGVPQPPAMPPEAQANGQGYQQLQQGAQPQAGSEQQRQQRQQRREDPQSLYLGVVSVPLPPAGNRDTTQPRTQQELNLQQDQKDAAQAAAYPAFGLRRAGGRRGGGGGSGAAAPGSATGGRGASLSATAAAAASSEVHLRRLDTFDTLHRRAVAAITIDAPPEAVWSVLTDYNALAEFVPNLAVSQRIALPRSAPPNIIRVRQVGYKRMPYMCLHAESVLDLIEKPQSEIQFRQVAGDFERFQGKWMLQGVSSSRGGGSGSGSSSDGESPASQTQLKYAVEILIPRATRMLGVLEPLLERTVFEDVPANLVAIKRRVESLQAERDISALEEAGEAAAAAALRRKLERPTLAEMVDDFSVLVAELERCFGEARVLPSRSELREMNRSDLEKAISAHGGPSLVAQQLGWKLKAKGRRPKGYWDSPQNVRAELDEFIEEQGLEPGVMPAKNDFVRAGRYDIARAVERWGGLYELAEELGYAVSDSRKQGSTEWQEHISEVAASTGLSGREGLFELAAKTYAARRSMQGSMDGSVGSSSGSGSSADEYALADTLAGSSSAGAATAAGRRAGAKPKPVGKAAQRGGLDKMPSLREEIDAW